MKLSTVEAPPRHEFSLQLTLLQSVTRTVAESIKARYLRRDACKSIGGGPARVALKSRQSNAATSRALNALACFVLIFVFAGRVSAAKHPVTLDPKADPPPSLASHQHKPKARW